MARTKQKLINFHSSGNTVVPFSELEYGEIAVRHRTQPGESELIIKTSTTSGVSFVEKSKVQTMISEGVSQVTTDMTEIAKSLSAVSATAVSVETTLANEIQTNGEFHDDVRTNLSGNVVTLIENLNDNYYTKDKVDDKLEERDTEIGNVKTDLTELSGVTSAFSASVVNDYAKSGSVVTEIGKASGAAVTSANSYTDTKLEGYYTSGQVDDLLSTINTDTSDLRTDLTELSGVTSAFSAYVATHYAQSGDVITEIGKASGAAVTSANSYTDTKLADYYTTGQVDTKLSTINTNTGKLSTDLTELSGSTTALSASVQTMSADVKSYIDDRLTTVYKFKGTKQTYAELPNNAEEGDVWNVVSAVGDSGSTGYTPAGTNYAWVPASEGAAAHWDALGGTIDLTGFATKEDLQEIDTESTQLRTDLTELSGVTSAFSAYVVTHYAQSGDVISEIGKASGAAVTSANSYTDTKLVDYYTTGQVDNLLSTINTNTGDLRTNLTQLSGVTSAFSAYVVTHYAQSGDVITEIGKASGAAVTSANSYTDTKLQDYYTTGQVDNKLSTINTNTGQLSTDLTELSGVTSAFMETVANTYAESGDVVTEIGKASGAAVTSANSYTDTKFEGYYTSGQVDNLLSTINTNTGDLRTNLTQLSGVTSALSASVQTIETKANSALQGFEFTGTNVTTSGTQTIQSGAKANYTTGGTATLDLSELVIDCGNW